MRNYIENKIAMLLVALVVFAPIYTTLFALGAILKYI